MIPILPREHCNDKCFNIEIENVSDFRYDHCTYNISIPFHFSISVFSPLNSGSSTSQYLKDIEISHEVDLCKLHHDDIQLVLLSETNALLGFRSIFESGFGSPAVIRYLQWNWWNKHVPTIHHYRTEVTFHGPSLSLSGPFHHRPYPLLRPSNFDTIDFEYPLHHISCRCLPNAVHPMTEVVASIWRDALHEAHDSNNLNSSHSNHTGHGTHGRNRHCGRGHGPAPPVFGSEELEEEIANLQMKWSVSGCFISKPYQRSAYDANGAFEVNVHCHWNMDCLDAMEQDASCYSVYIIPSHPMERGKMNVISVDGSYAAIGSDEKGIHGKIRIYPEIEDDDDGHQNGQQTQTVQQTVHQTVNTVANPQSAQERQNGDRLRNSKMKQNEDISSRSKASRKRSREEMEVSVESTDGQNGMNGMDETEGNVMGNLQSLNIMPTAITGTITPQTKRRKLSVHWKEEMDGTEESPLSGPEQPARKLKSKSSNRKSPKTVHRHGNRVSVTVEKKSTKNRRSPRQNHNVVVPNNGDDGNGQYPNGQNVNGQNGPNISMMSASSSGSADDDTKYRGYFLAIFVPRSPELLSAYFGDHTTLQPFVRGHIVFYDGIYVDENGGKPSSENYEWIMRQIATTYKEKGRNLEHFSRMKEELEQLRRAHAAQRKQGQQRIERNRRRGQPESTTFETNVERTVVTMDPPAAPPNVDSESSNSPVEDLMALPEALRNGFEPSSISPQAPDAAVLPGDGRET